jgi:hypothetical protein
MVPQAELGPVEQAPAGTDRIYFNDYFNRTCSLEQTTAIGADGRVGSESVMLGVVEFGKVHLSRRNVEGLVTALRRWLSTNKFAPPEPQPTRIDR